MFNCRYSCRLRHGAHALFVLALLFACSGAIFAAEAPESQLWFEGGRPKVVAWQAVDILQEAAADGLAADDYDAAGLRNILTALEGGVSLPEADILALDATMTRAMRRYLVDLHFGRIDPREVHTGFPMPRANGFDPETYLRTAVLGGRLRRRRSLYTRPCAGRWDATGSWPAIRCVRACGTGRCRRYPVASWSRAMPGRARKCWPAAWWPSATCRPRRLCRKLTTEPLFRG